MTREEFVERMVEQLGNEIGGILLDAITAGRSGSEAYIWLKRQGGIVKQKIELALEEVKKQREEPSSPTAQKGQGK